jgi:PAS domain S-box-containing protein
MENLIKPGRILPNQKRKFHGRDRIMQKEEISQPVTPEMDASLCKNRRILMSTIESLPFEFLAIDRSGSCILQNSSCKARWGDLTGKQPEEFPFSEDMLRYWRETNECALTGRVVKGEVEYTCQGHKRTFYNIIIPIRDGDAIQGLMGIHIDITAQKQAEAALRESAHRYHSLVEITSDWIWEVDPIGKYTYSNRNVEDILGYSPQEIVGKTPFDFMPPDEAEKQSSVFRKIVAAQKPFSDLENVNLHKSGRKVVLETSGVPLFDENGVFSGFRGIDRDVTARKRLDDELKQAHDDLEIKVKKTTSEIEAKRTTLQDEMRIRKQIQADLIQSENQFRILLETLNEGFGMVDSEGRFSYANQKMLDILGRSRTAVVGEKCSDFLDEKNRHILKKQLSIRKTGIEKPYEMQFTSKDGKIISTIVSPRGLFDKSGRFKGSFAAITDISDMKASEKALRRREQQLKAKTLSLQEMNSALEVLLRKREQDKSIIQRRILANLGRLVIPYLDSLANTRLSERQRFLVDVVKSNLREILSPFSEKLSAQQIALTRAELQVANLVKLGKSTEQIASDLSISYKTAETHRLRIRKKLGLTHQKANLMSHLLKFGNPV